jgi:hypothetical protein
MAIITANKVAFTDIIMVAAIKSIEELIAVFVKN